MTSRLTNEGIDAAVGQLADARGLDGVTMTALAQQLGVKPPSLYGHVRNRAALLDRLTCFALTTLTDSLGDALAGRSGRDALDAFAAVHRDLARSAPGLWAALQRPVDAEVAAASDGARLVALTRAVLRGYGVPEADSVHAVRLLGATVSGMVSLERSGGFSHSPPGPAETWIRAIDALHVLFTTWPPSDERGTS